MCPDCGRDYGAAAHESCEAQLNDARLERDAYMKSYAKAIEEREQLRQERDEARRAYDDADAALQALMAKYDPQAEQRLSEYRSALEFIERVVGSEWPSICNRDSNSYCAGEICPIHDVRREARDVLAAQEDKE